jgi:hypothetical protein
LRKSKKVASKKRRRSAKLAQGAGTGEYDIKCRYDHISIISLLRRRSRMKKALPIYFDLTRLPSRWPLFTSLWQQVNPTVLMASTMAKGFYIYERKVLISRKKYFKGVKWTL